jgi:hypothetical protein
VRQGEWSLPFAHPAVLFPDTGQGHFLIRLRENNNLPELQFRRHGTVFPEKDFFGFLRNVIHTRTIQAHKLFL